MVGMFHTGIGAIAGAARLAAIADGLWGMPHAAAQ
jgi:hypothetical protein